MKIIVGLGNPGKKYENTRHNVGFLGLDRIVIKLKVDSYKVEDFKLEKKFDAEVAKFKLKDEDIVLVKPQTFMNESGKAVKGLLKNKTAETLIIIHDDIDLPVGKIKIIKERGSAGHKGVESIIKNIGNDGLIRFRIGIGSENKTEAMKVVLKNFSEAEQKTVDMTVDMTVNALEMFIKEGLEKAMNRFNS